jgi:hypothetical protein
VHSNERAPPNDGSYRQGLRGGGWRHFGSYGISIFTPNAPPDGEGSITDPRSDGKVDTGVSWRVHIDRCGSTSFFAEHYPEAREKSPGQVRNL